MVGKLVIKKTNNELGFIFYFCGTEVEKGGEKLARYWNWN